MADRGKREEDGSTKIRVSRERKELFRWNKKHFSWFLKGYHLVRNKKLIKNSGHKLKTFVKFTGKHLCKSLFFIKVAGLTLGSLLKKRLAHVFSCEFYKIFKNISFTEHLRATASEINGLVSVIWNTWVISGWMHPVNNIH